METLRIFMDALTIVADIVLIIAILRRWKK